MGRLPFGAWSWLACARLVRSVAVLVAVVGCRVARLDALCVPSAWRLVSVRALMRSA